MKLEVGFFYEPILLDFEVLIEGQLTLIRTVNIQTMNLLLYSQTICQDEVKMLSTSTKVKLRQKCGLWPIFTKGAKSPGVELKYPV